MIRCCFALPGLAAFALLVGCESYDPDDGVIVMGKIVQGGQPISGNVQVVLIGNQIRSSATCDSSGSFKIVDAGEGVPAGKYKVAVAVFESGGPNRPPGAGPPGAGLPSGSRPPGGGPPGGAPSGDGPPSGPPTGPPNVTQGDKLEGKLSETNTKIEVDVPQDKVGGTHDVGTIDIAEHLK